MKALPLVLSCIECPARARGDQVVGGAGTRSTKYTIAGDLNAALCGAAVPATDAGKR